jgi:hypothetical protein
MEQLYYSASLKEYLLADTDRICDKCKNLLLEEGLSCVFIREVGRTFDDIKIYCFKCSSEVEANPFAKLITKNYARIFKQIPEDSILIIPSRPTLQNIGKMQESFLVDTGLTSFDIEGINKSYKGGVSDKTRLAARESWAGSQIGASITPELEKLDKPLQLEEGLDFFNELSKSELVLPGVEEVKQLEEK